MTDGKTTFRRAAWREKNLESGPPKGVAPLAGVLVHGRYRTPEEMIYLASRLGHGEIRWLAPAAEDRTWYPKLFMDPVADNEPFVSQALARIDQTLDQASEGGRLDASRLILLGFSQGACLTLEYALRNPGRCRTLIAFTGGLFGPPGTQWPEAAGVLRGSNIFLTSSDVDEWIPESRVHESAAVLAARGAAVRVRICAGRPHEVSEAELLEAGEFISSAATF